MTKYNYQRLSTQDKQSFIRQEKFARDHNIPQENWFQEKASGAKKDRPKLKQLLSLIKEGDELYVIDASRLTRSLSQMLEILEFAKEKKIKLVMGDFILDCKGELSILTQGQLMMLGMINEINRLMIVESVREGVLAAREQGRIGGRPRTSRDNIPDVFYRYYPQYKSGQLNKSELSRISGLCYDTVLKYIKIVESKSQR